VVPADPLPSDDESVVVIPTATTATRTPAAAMAGNQRFTSVFDDERPPDGRGRRDR